MMAKRHGCWVAVIVAIGIGPVATTNGDQGRIRIWPTASVDSPAVMLGDIAEVSGLSLDQTARVMAVEVSIAPREGGEALLRADDVRGALLDAGLNLAELNILGSSRCRVTRPAAVRKAPAPRTVRTTAAKPKPSRKSGRSPIDSARPAKAAPNTLEAALRNHIEARNAESDAKLEVRFSPVSARDLGMTSPPYSFEIHSRGEKSLGLVSYEVTVREDGEVNRVLPVVAEVTLIKDVLVARRPINRGETIEGRALKLESRRFTDAGAIGMTDPEAAIGMQSRTFIRAGEMVSVAGVQARPLVTRGQPVTVWMRQGGLVIRTNGKAQQEGALGDTIEVLRETAKRQKDLFDAVVTGPGTVTVGESRQVAMQTVGGQP